MSLPDLGVGLIYLPGLEPLLEAGLHLLDVVEIEPQTSWSRTGTGYRERDGVLARLDATGRPTLVHGVGFPVGGTAPADPAALAAFADTVARTAAPWCSEHLSFNRVRTAGADFGMDRASREHTANRGRRIRTDLISSPAHGFRIL